MMFTLAETSLYQKSTFFLVSSLNYFCCLEENLNFTSFVGNRRQEQWSNNYFETYLQN